MYVRSQTLSHQFQIYATFSLVLKAFDDLIYIICFSLASRRPTTAPVASKVSGSASAATRGRGSSAAKKESKPPSSSLLAKSPSSSTSSLSKPPAQGGTKGTTASVAGQVLLAPLSFLFKKWEEEGKVVKKCLGSEISFVSCYI